VCLTKDEWLWALGSTPWDAPTQEKREFLLHLEKREARRVTGEELDQNVDIAPVVEIVP